MDTSEKLAWALLSAEDCLNRAIRAEAEVERLKEAIYEALNNEEDRADYDCKCLDCQYTLTGVGETLRKALEAKP